MFRSPYDETLQAKIRDMAFVEGENRFTISMVNSEHKVCTSYPPMLIVPMDTSDKLLQNLAKNRVNGRFPVWVWKHLPTDTNVWIGSTKMDKFKISKDWDSVNYYKKIGETHPNGKVFLVDLTSSKKISGDKSFIQKNEKSIDI